MSRFGVFKRQNVFGKSILYGLYSINRSYHVQSLNYSINTVMVRQREKTLYNKFSANNQLFLSDVCFNRRFIHTSSKLQCQQDVDKSRYFIPKLMEYPNILMPSVINSIATWILIKLVIKPYLDESFCIKDFMNGAKQAVTYISSLLVEGNFDELRSIVTSEAYDEIYRNYTSFDALQRSKLIAKDENITLAFPYNLGITINDENPKHRYVEILTVFYVMRARMNTEGNLMQEVKNNSDKLTIYNIRFGKLFAKDVESSWTINMINCFHPDAMNVTV